EAPAGGDYDRRPCSHRRIGRKDGQRRRDDVADSLASAELVNKGILDLGPTLRAGGPVGPQRDDTHGHSDPLRWLRGALVVPPTWPSGPQSGGRRRLMVGRDGGAISSMTDPSGRGAGGGIIGLVEIIDDLAAELARIESILDSLDGSDWARPSLCPGWSISDVVLHLAQTQEAAAATVNRPVTDRSQAVEPRGVDA